jgi:integrase
VNIRELDRKKQLEFVRAMRERGLADWTISTRLRGANVMTYYGRPLATREFYDLLAEKASVTGGPNIIRHTVRTWLAEGGVPDAEADVFMGHTKLKVVLPASATFTDVPNTCGA